MVCIYCHAKTQVINSRPHDKKYATWRRRVCTACEAVFTTQESPLLSAALVVQGKDKHLRAFSRDTLFLSIHESCRHREQSVQDATALTKTVITRLLQSPNTNPGVVSVLDITEATYCTLTAFDVVAAVHYKAYYMHSGKRLQ